MRFLIGFLTGLFFSVLGSPMVFDILYSLCPGFWAWALLLPAFGYWVGQAARNPTEAGLACGFILLPLVLWLPDLPYLGNRILIPGGCGTGRRWAWTQATALLVCIPAALGLLRYFLRRRPLNRWPEGELDESPPRWLGGQLPG